MSHEDQGELQSNDSGAQLESLKTSELASTEQGWFVTLMRELFRVRHDPANLAPCADCEGAGYLLTVSGRETPCSVCYGEGTVMIRNPFAGIGGGALGGNLK